MKHRAKLIPLNSVNAKDFLTDEYISRYKLKYNLCGLSLYVFILKKKQLGVKYVSFWGTGQYALINFIYAAINKQVLTSSSKRPRDWHIALFRVNPTVKRFPLIFLRHHQLNI